MKVMLTCVSWYSIAVYIDCDIVNYMLAGCIDVVFRMVYSEVELLPVAFQRLCYVKPH